MGKTIMYERIYGDLLAKIQSGDYQPGDRLPSEKELAELYGVSRITAKKAMDMLAKENQINREPGRGSFVCRPAAVVEIKKESQEAANQRIGVIFDGFGSDFGTRLLQGIESECDRRQLDLLFKCTYGSIEKEKQAIDAAIRAGVKGILLLCAQGDNYNSKVLELALAGYPLVLVDRRMQGISIPCVRTDNYEAAKEVTKKLIAMGHEKICFLTHASVTTTTIHERYEGFVHCMLKYEDANGALAKLEKYNHTPFGHAGEYILNEICEDGFAHYKQSVRVVEILEKKGQGLNLTKEVRDGMLNHRTSGNPATMEGKIVRFSDKIAYINHDIDDAIRGKIITERDIPREYADVLGDTVKDRLNNMIHDIINNSMDKPSIFMSPDVERAMRGLREWMFEHVYRNPAAKGEEGRAQQLIVTLYEYYLKHVDELPEEYLAMMELRGEKRERVVCDYIAGMSDGYAIDRFEELFVPKGWNV